MNMIKAIVVLSLLFAGAAHADVAPPDRCSSEGQRCDNGGPDANQPGVCTPSQCFRGGPDGPVAYDCLTCVPDGGGEAGGASAGAGGSGSGVGSDGGCDCRVVAPSSERAVAGVLLLLGLTALAWSRRRR
jgi:MYXO-CTERM domain-containing protein